MFNCLHLQIHKHTNVIHTSLQYFENKQNQNCILKKANMALSYYFRFGEQLGSNRSLNYQLCVYYCFSAHPCIVGEWSHWSGCAEQCKPSLRIRRRYVQQEPTNAGEPCPALEEKAGCLEYLTYQGQDCGHEHGILSLSGLFD